MLLAVAILLDVKLVLTVKSEGKITFIATEVLVVPVITAPEKPDIKPPTPSVVPTLAAPTTLA